jgi:DNA-binding transcriptional ArsR family regulator
MRRDVFQAIADPTRRAIINLLALKTMTPSDVADAFDVSRQAISRHIKILTECGLIVMTQQGRERYCAAQLGPLNEVSSWVGQYRQYWDGKMDALDLYLDKLQKDQKNGRKK